MNIKRGVSLYSYQEEYFLRKMSLESCIKAVSDMGATGIEIIPEQMINEFPNLSDTFLEKWFGWMQTYRTTPTCADAFLDALLFKNRILSDGEQVDLMERDLRVARQLGCFVIRTLCTTPVRIIERSLPLAQKYGVKIGLEIHAPLNLDSAWFEPYQALMDKYGDEWFGIIPDMGIFEKVPSRIHRERLVREGASKKITDYITEAFLNHDSRAKIEAQADLMGAASKDMAWIAYCFRSLYTNPRILKQHKNHIFHIHAKFYDMLPDCTDDCLDYTEVVKVLKEIGYEGYLSSEYEGNRTIQDAYPVDSVVQVSRQHRMFEQLLAQ